MLPYRTFSYSDKTGEKQSGQITVKPVSTIDKIAREITARGNDVEVRTCREGIKVLEVTKRVVAVFPTE